MLYKAELNGANSTGQKFDEARKTLNNIIIKNIGRTATVGQDIYIFRNVTVFFLKCFGFTTVKPKFHRADFSF
jgi:hypothetical protein